MTNNLVAIILTHNEELHIERCISSLLGVTSQIFIVDSFSADETVTIARSLGAIVVQRKWKNYADQFQWALDHYSEYCGGECSWLMRMDADEYLESDLIREIPSVIQLSEADIVGYYIRRKVIFYGKWIRYGGFYPHTLLRIWRVGRGRIEQRWMDEHIVLAEGDRTSMLLGHLVDDNLKGITFWVDKHNSYASREMVDLLNIKYDLLPKDDTLITSNDPQAKWKRILKNEVYSRMPVSFRSTVYFLYRYILRLGFLDGPKGFLWHFMQGFWYRMLVDAKLMEIEAKAAGNPDKIRFYLIRDYGIRL